MPLKYKHIGAPRMRSGGAVAESDWHCARQVEGSSRGGDKGGIARAASIQRSARQTRLAVAAKNSSAPPARLPRWRISDTGAHKIP